MKSREEKARGVHDLGALPREGSHSPLKHTTGRICSLLSLPLLPTPARHPSPIWAKLLLPITQQACLALPSLPQSKPYQSSQVCASILCWSCHQQSLAGPTWGMEKKKKYFPQFS
jgi:hypothetical protein